MKWLLPPGRRRILAAVQAALLWMVPVAFAGQAGIQQPGMAGAEGAESPAAAQRVLTLEQCREMAWQKNNRRPASRFAVAMAEAQHRQALAGYWPQVNMKAGYQRLDEPLNFLFPASAMQIPSQTVSAPGGAALVTIPANAFGPGFPPADVQMPVAYPGQSITTPAQVFPVPEYDVKVMDRNVATGVVDMKWLLFDGGMRGGLRAQSGAFVDMMKTEVRRTDLELTDSVQRIYWGAVLARQLRRLGQDTLDRMETTLKLTETMYKEGSGRVTKADYLDNLVMVESIRSMVAQLDKNEALTQAALANAVGLGWKENVAPAAEEIPFAPLAATADELVAASFQFNPDWTKLESALRAAQGMLTTARSGYWPKIALTGELHRFWNGSSTSGVSTPQNRTGWSAGVGMEFPLFDGLLTRNRVSEAQARIEQMKRTQLLLREGLGLQVRDALLSLEAGTKSCRATERAMQSAAENRDLNTRAYMSELVETEKVLKAQLMEALMSAQHYKARYDYVAAQSHLSLIVGTEVRQRLAVGR